MILEDFAPLQRKNKGELTIIGKNRQVLFDY